MVGRRAGARIATVSGLAMLVVTAPAAAAVEPCTSCADCQAKLASGLHATVQLTTDIVDQSGTCIDLTSGESDVEFDCAGHLIDSDELGVDPVQGLAMMHGSRVTVRSCRISDFDSGIYVVDATALNLADNHLISNRIGLDLSNAHENEIAGNRVEGSSTGIKLSNSDDNTIHRNWSCGNFPWDIYLGYDSTGNLGTENTCEFTRYWNDLSIDGCTYACPFFSDGFESADCSAWSESVP